MPIYIYNCENCDKEFDVWKPIAEYNTPEACPKCKAEGVKLWKSAKTSASHVHFTGTKIEDAEYNIGLGCITKSRRHREELAKRKGLIELGNEKPDTVHKIFDNQREEKRKKSWETD